MGASRRSFVYRSAVRGRRAPCSRPESPDLAPPRSRVGPPRGERHSPSASPMKPLSAGAIRGRRPAAAAPRTRHGAGRHRTASRRRDAQRRCRRDATAANLAAPKSTPRDLKTFDSRVALAPATPSCPRSTVRRRSRLSAALLGSGLADARSCRRLRCGVTARNPRRRRPSCCRALAAGLGNVTCTCDVTQQFNYRSNVNVSTSLRVVVGTPRASVPPPPTPFYRHICDVIELISARPFLPSAERRLQMLRCKGTSAAELSLRNVTNIVTLHTRS